jgi:hypothetical protein
MKDVWEQSIRWKTLGRKERKTALVHRIRVLEIALAYSGRSRHLGRYQRLIEAEMKKREAQLEYVEMDSNE